MLSIFRPTSRHWSLHHSKSNQTRSPRSAVRRVVIVSFIFAALLSLTSLPFLDGAAVKKRPLSLQDMMKFKYIKNPVLSEDGNWVVYTVKPDRGNSEVIITHTSNGKTYTIPLASNPQLSKNGKWVAVKINEDAIKKERKKAEKEKKKEKKKEKAEKKNEEKNKPDDKRDDDKRNKVSMSLIDTASGKILPFKGVKSFSFSDDSQWLVYTMHPEKKKKDKSKEKKAKKGSEKEGKKEEPGDQRRRPGARKGPDAKNLKELVVRSLESGKETVIKGVAAFEIDPASRFLVYSIKASAPKDKNNKDKSDKDKVEKDKVEKDKVGGDKDCKVKNGLYALDLKNNKDLNKKAKQLHALPDAEYSNLAWSKTKSRLGFLVHKEHKEKQGDDEKNSVDKKKIDKKKSQTFTSVLMVWDGVRNELTEAVPPAKRPAGWIIPSENSITWTKDEERMFFGFKPADEYDFTHPVKKKAGDFDFYGIDRLLEKRGVDVWHWNDPLLNSNQKKQWERLKKRIYPAVYFFSSRKAAHLTGKDMPRLERPENPDTALGFSSVPYMRDRTWDGFYEDVYVVKLRDGSREKLLTRYGDEDVHLSPNGKYVAYYLDKNWYLYDVAAGLARNLTKSIDTPFYNEDHDYPSSVPGYGIGGWTLDDRSVFIYDKYDIWEFFTDGSAPVCRTEGKGRKQQIEFRIVRLDPEQQFYQTGEAALLRGYSHQDKSSAFYNAAIGKNGVTLRLDGPKYFRFLQKAKKADKILFTRESYREFPDLWVSSLNLKKPKRITRLGSQVDEFLWGNARLIEWNSLDNVPLQGIVITPENYNPKKRYPVLVYYYRFFTQRLHRFSQVVVNHRPCYPFYSGSDYVIFLPDIRFQIGRPGFAATKCLVPGVQKLIDMGIADAKAIGLHGHSWSGYQTAFMVTQTDMFAAAVAGAPVSNMTSAYNGIRWGTGLARQFQYEKSQSRIGPSLIEAPHLYIENSPVFFADRIQTPLLIEFGDEDGAVPWYQGIELYLMMRRLNKNCIFLQYNGEPHHLTKYPNKLDYTIKMKQFFDHHLKGAPAPAWMTEGVPYQKDK